MKSERALVWSGFAAISFIWGSTWLAIKIGLDSVPPFLGVGMRFLLAAVILHVIVKLRKVEIPLTRDAKVLYLTLITISYSIPFGLVYWAGQHIPSGLASILFAGYPFWVGIMSQWFLPGERMNLFKLAGIVMGFVGLMVIFSQDVHWENTEGFLGMGAILVSTIMQATSTIVVKRLGQNMSPFAMNYVGMLFGGLLLLIFGLSTESVSDIRWDAAAILSIIYLALFGSVVAFVTYYWLLKRIQVVYLSLTTFINPIIAVILGAIVLGEALETTVYVGAALVLTGILVANGKYLYDQVTRRV